MSVPMRRGRQRLSDDDARALLASGEYGVLSTGGTAAGGYPYGVPLSYAYVAEPAGGAPRGRLYFHGAPEGHKLDALAEDPRVSFVVVAQNEVAPEQLTNVYRSVIAFGTARLAVDDDEKRRGLEALGYRYCPGLEEKVAAEVEGSLDRTAVVVVDVEELVAKEAIELARSRRP